MAEEDEGRKKALQLYRISALMLGLLGIVLLICGLLAVMNKSSNDGGLPYFLGGFIVGILTLTSAAVCTCIFLKAPSADSDVKKKELACVIQGQYLLSMFSILGCFFGVISAGIGGFVSSDLDDEEEEEDDGPKKTFAIMIIIGCICAIFLIIFSLCVVCTYGSYFGVNVQGGRRRIVVIDTDGQTTIPTFFQTNTFKTGMQANNIQMSQLETQNRLLQQQLDLQRQMFEHQQQQQQQAQYSTGNNPPPYPAYGFNNTDTTASPPIQYNVK